MPLVIMQFLSQFVGVVFVFLRIVLLLVPKLHGVWFQVMFVCFGDWNMWTLQIEARKIWCQFGSLKMCLPFSCYVCLLASCVYFLRLFRPYTKTTSNILFINGNMRNRRAIALSLQQVIDWFLGSCACHWVMWFLSEFLVSCGYSWGCLLLAPNLWIWVWVWITCGCYMNGNMW